MTQGNSQTKPMMVFPQDRISEEDVMTFVGEMILEAESQITDAKLLVQGVFEKI